MSLSKPQQIAVNPPKKQKNCTIKLSKDEIKAIRVSTENKNTRKRNESAESKLKNHLKMNGFPNDVDLAQLSYDDLNPVLEHFWFEIRQEDGSKYRASSLENIFHAMKRCLSSYGFKELNKSSKWARAFEAYQDALKQLKMDGLGFVENYPEIPTAGM